MQLAMENTDFKLEYLTDSHTKGLCDLYKRVFQKEVTEEYFSIKYGLFDAERIQCATVALINDDIIGFYGAYLTEFCDYNRKDTLKLVHTCDYILLEEFRGKGVLDHLYLHSLKEMKQQNADFAYGFHSVQTYKFSQKYSWVDTLFFKRFHLQLFPKKVAQGLRKIGMEKTLRKRLEKALESYIIKCDLDTLNKTPKKYTQKYDSAFFKMKEFCPHYLVEIEGCTLWLKYDLYIAVGFVHFPESGRANYLIETLKKIVGKVGIHELIFHVQDQSPEFSLLDNWQEAQPSFKISYLRLSDSDVAFENVKLNFMDMDIF